VIAVDTNLLVYAHRGDSQWHDAAAAVVRRLAEGGAPWAVPWPCVHEFLAIATHPRIFKTPTPLPSALGQVDAWLESPSIVLLGEAEGYWDGLRTLVTHARTNGPRVHDARIAAICLGHHVRELWTADRDFSVFPALKVRNPLVSAV
jgi:toxin-antitoxin system PIN domain toxin